MCDTSVFYGATNRDKLSGSFLVEEWSTEQSNSILRKCLRLARAFLEEQTLSRAHTSASSSPSYSKNGTAIKNTALSEQLQPLVVQIRQEGWGTGDPPCVHTVSTVTQAGQPIEEFLRTTDAPRVAQELGIVWPAMQSLILSGVNALLSSVDISFRDHSSTLKTGITIHWREGFISIKEPTDIRATQGRELVSTVLKLLEASKTKAFDEEDKRIFHYVKSIR